MTHHSTSEAPSRRPRILHAAATISHSSGIAHQMEWEQKAATSLRLPWTCRYWTLDTIRFAKVSHDQTRFVLASGSRKTFASWMSLRFRYTTWLFGEARCHDLVLLRHSLHDPLQVAFLALYGRKCILVHHAIEDCELASLGWTTRSSRRLLERACGFLSLRFVAGLIGVTDEIREYQVARSRRKAIWSATYPNGIDGDFIPVEDLRSEVPRFIFIASSFLPWQGLDLLIESARGSDRNFIIDVVGDVPEDLVNRAARDQRFLFHGHLSNESIRTIARHADMGVSSLALDRMGLSQACALKVRQYLAWGLPALGSYEETLGQDFPFYLKVPPDLGELLLAADRFRSTERLEVAQAARPLIEKKVLVETLWQKL